MNKRFIVALLLEIVIVPPFLYLTLLLGFDGKVIALKFSFDKDKFFLNFLNHLGV